MRDTVIGAAEGVARGWREEADRRRELSKTDPVADTLAYCAGELLARLRPVSITERDSVSVERFAELMGVSAQTVRQWCRRGLVPARMVGTGWMIRADAERPGRTRKSA